VVASAVKNTDHRRPRWLHFSDIHVGVGGQPQLWPAFESELLNDLKRLHERAGSVDFVIFSGDLVQKGTAEEYKRFHAIINSLLDRISERQARPKLITVPGNHDLVRPDAISPEGIALKQFWKDQALRTQLWEKQGRSYRQFLDTTFKNYTDWRSSAIEAGIHEKPENIGILPGDASYVLDVNGEQFGIIALNSTWLQLSGSGYDGELHVDIRQLLKVTENAPDKWTEKNDYNLLVTHHPESWLHANTPSTWANDINPPGRFDAHLFGHMHEPVTTSLSHGGSAARRGMQAASLFGLETYEDKHTRLQGYSLTQITNHSGGRAITSWPRRLVTVSSGKMKLTPDVTQDLDEDSGSFTIYYGSRNSDGFLRNGETSNDLPAPTINLSSKHNFDLIAIQHIVAESRAHANVRKIEQETCTSALRSSRIIWLISDWGMGSDGFIASIRKSLSVPNHHIYSVDFGSYTNRESFFDSLHTRLGVSFQGIGEAVAAVGPAILIFDDVEIPADATRESLVEREIDDLARAISDFASDAFILIRSRRAPRETTIRTVGLKALDEPDVATYARESESGGERYGKPDAASTLFRHTDGVPARIDLALRDLEIMSLGDLISADPDFGHSGSGDPAAPPALAATVNELKNCENKSEQRAYELLLALSALPQGEQLARLKRFLGVHPFGIIHARALLDRSLIDTSHLTTLDGMKDASTNKLLIVPRPVRDFVRESMDKETAASIDRKALDLYFGTDWPEGRIDNSATAKRVGEALCDGYEIQNAGMLILRSLKRSLECDDVLDAEGTVRLATAFIGTLMKGNHYRATVTFCEDVMRFLGEAEAFEKEMTSVRFNYARCLRMTGRRVEAISAFETLDHAHLNKFQRQNAELGLALCLDSQGDEAGAKSAAERVIKIDKSTSAALHSEMIIAEQIVDQTARQKTLQRLLEKARKRESHTLVHNILISLAKEDDDSQEILKQVVQGARAKGDFYNVARAIVELSSKPGAERTLTNSEKDRLIEAYHYLYNERFSSLFERCHGALWRLFEANNDRANLLNLFRHSSFIWRLSGRETHEIEYLNKLTRHFRDMIREGLAAATRDGAYLIVRATVVLGSSPATAIDRKPNEVPS